MNRTASPVARHAEIWDLLPWYANETLDEDARSRVEAHLESCGECSRELAFLSGLSSTMAGEEMLLVSPERSLAAVSERIDALEAARRGSFGWGDIARIVGAKLATRRVDAGRRLRPALAALGAILLVALVAGLWIGLSSPEFRTLSSDTAAAQLEPSAIRLVFAEDATMHEVQQLLSRLDVSLIGGPSTYGVFTARLGERAGGESFQQTLTELRGDRLVTFAEPIDGPPAEGVER